MSAGYCFAGNGRSALIALLISSGSLFVFERDSLVPQTTPVRVKSVQWLVAVCLRALEPSCVFRSISWLASL